MNVKRIRVPRSRSGIALAVLSLLMLVPASSADGIDETGGNVTVSIGDGVVLEGDHAVTGKPRVLRFPVTLSAPIIVGAPTVTVVTGDVTATSPDDFVAAPRQISFAGGYTLRYFDVVINPDTTPEPSETIVAAIWGVTGASLGRYVGYGTILDDDYNGRLIVAATVPSVVEPDSGGRTVEIAFQLSQAASSPVTGTYRLAGATATQGTDFSGTLTGSFSIPAGDLKSVKSVTIRADSEPELDEVFRVTLLSVSSNADPLWSGVTHGLWGVGSATIFDNDASGMFATGKNDVGQLGDGTTIYRTLPGVELPAQPPSGTTPSPPRLLTAGGQHACAIMVDKSLWCWGNNGDGRLGLGYSHNFNTTDFVPAPTQVGSGAWRDVGAGNIHTCGINDADESVYCWGEGDLFRLGFNYSDQSSPTLVPVVPGAIDVDAGADHTCAVDPNHTVWCWGAQGSSTVNDGRLGICNFEDPYGVCGRYDPPELWLDSAPPTRIGIASNGVRPLATEVSAGGAHTCIISPSTSSDANATGLYCWGSNEHHQLGIADSELDSTPIRDRDPVPGSNDPEFVHVGGPGQWAPKRIDVGFRHVSAGGAHTCGIYFTGKLFCWGDNAQGQLGLGDRNERTVKMQVGADADWSMVTAGDDHTCAQKNDRSIWCWGSNANGQLGDGTTETQLRPKLVMSGYLWRTVVAGSGFTIAGRRTS